MKMKFDRLVYSRFGVGNALFLSRVLTPRMGFLLGDWVADRISARKNTAMVRAVRTNQWVISDGRLTGEALEQRVRDVFRFKAHALYTYYHYLGVPEKMNTIQFSPAMEQLAARIRQPGQPTMLAILHLGNFDRAGYAMAVRGLQFQILSYPNPSAGYRWENRLRQEVGMLVTPMSVESMRHAKQRLLDGGTVLTGLDRPLVDSNYAVNFFGRQTLLPVAYLKMALQTQSPVAILGTFVQPDGTLLLDATPVMEMQPYPDREKEITLNANRVLKEAEEMIRRAPQQWTMFFPVWPEAEAELSRTAQV